MLDSALSGFLTALSLIVAIGAQNAYVLRQGVRRSHVGPVVAICTLSDFVLILAGVSGVGAIVTHAGWALLAVRWLGVTFLACYGLSSAWRARKPTTGLSSGAHSPGGLGSGELSTAGLSTAGLAEAVGPVVRRALALTWLNPHVYLDTVLLIGSVAATHGHAGRWWFAVGACAVSPLWFTGLGYGAGLLGPLLVRPRAWQVLDLLVAATMVVIAVRLATG